MQNGCTTIGEQVPEVTSIMINAAGQRGIETSSLQIGRQLFLERCGDCHALQAPGGRNSMQWRTVMNVMAPRAHLNPEQKAQVLAYLTIVAENKPMLN